MKDEELNILMWAYSGECVWQEPDLAEVYISGVSIISGHDHIVWVLVGEASDQARVEIVHLAAPEHADAAPEGELTYRLRP